MIIGHEKLGSILREIALRAGTSEFEAETMAESVVLAELRGLSSHGVVRYPSYVERISMGLYATHVEPEITKDAGTLFMVDGKNAIGAPLAMWTMRRCVDRAAEHGVCFAAVNHGNHFGIGAYYTGYAAKHGMIGFAVANANAWVAPIGGREKKLGTNPLSISVPGKKDVFLLDMATSEAAQGKVVVAEKKGVQVPFGWGVDSEGKPTQDPSAILHGGALLAFGGAKGYGICLLIEILCAALAGGTRSNVMGSMFARDKIIGTGMFMGAIDVSKLVDPETFDTRVDEIYEDIRSTGALIPGEIEAGKEETSREKGIDVPDSIFEDLRALAERYGVEV